MAVIVLLPTFSASARVVSKVSSVVARPRMISTSFIAGTGFMKCIPITLSARLVLAPILVIEIEDVFEARITSGRQILSRR